MLCTAKARRHYLQVIIIITAVIIAGNHGRYDLHYRKTERLQSLQAEHGRHGLDRFDDVADFALFVHRQMTCSASIIDEKRARGAKGVRLMLIPCRHSRDRG